MKHKIPINLHQIIADPHLAQFADERQDGRRRRVPRPDSVADAVADQSYRLALGVLAAADAGLAATFPNSVAPVTLDADDLEGVDLLAAWCNAAQDERRALIADALRAVAVTIHPDGDDARGELRRYRHGSQCADGSAHPVAPSLPELGVRLVAVLAEQFVREVNSQPDPADTN